MKVAPLIDAAVIPASLILAQAATESAWGSSRFARDGYNFFGIWCFKEGCGMTPLNRNEGGSHEVQKFSRVLSGVRVYINTLNTHQAYEDFRERRSNIRKQGRNPMSYDLTPGLLYYSERRQAYVEEIELNDIIKAEKRRRFNGRVVNNRWPRSCRIAFP